MPIVKVHGTGSELQGVARLEDGRTVFIPLSLPGEEVEIELKRQKERFAEGRLKRVLSQSSERVQPDCPYYGACGGCQTRHMRYEASLAYKREKVIAALTRLGGIIKPEVLPVLPSPLINSYRNKAEFACAGNALGVYREGSSNVIDVQCCLLQPERMNALLDSLRPSVQALHLSGIVMRMNSEGELMVILCASKADKRMNSVAMELMKRHSDIKSVYLCLLNPRPAHALDGACRLLSGSERLNETLLGLYFTVSPKSFFQVNRLQAEKLYETALSFADLTQADEICDLYCGTGTITLCAAQRCKSAVGIELVPDAIRDARKNAESNALTAKAEFFCDDAGKAYPKLTRQRHFSAVFVDPPRKGLEKSIVDALIDFPTPRLIYVSCDPATLSRDVKLLTQSGVYCFIKAQPVDMFPGTSHCEVVTLITRA